MIAKIPLLALTSHEKQRQITKIFTILHSKLDIIGTTFN
jgi:hypothetical protein